MSHPTHDETLHVRTEIDIEKILVFLRANAHRVHFAVDGALVDRTLKRLERFAREHPGKVVIEVCTPEGSRTLQYAAAGAATGAMLGLVLGGLTTAAAGALVGAACGVMVAHVHLRVEIPAVGGPALVSVA